MSEDSTKAVWYCVVVRDPRTSQFRHYRCLWSRRDAEVYKLQLEQAGDLTEQPSNVVTIETLPAGELPKHTLSRQSG